MAFGSDHWALAEVRVSRDLSTGGSVSATVEDGVLRVRVVNSEGNQEFLDYLLVPVVQKWVEVDDD